MCKLVEQLRRKYFIGYKVVARFPKGKRYYSVAMGFRYPKDGKIPVITKQRRLSCYFDNNILDRSDFNPNFSEGMIGRTAVFDNASGAFSLLCNLTSYLTKYTKCSTKMVFVIVKAKISGSLMRGTYGSQIYVVAGRKIEFLEEIKQEESWKN